MFDCLGFTDVSTYLLSRKKTSLEVIAQLVPGVFTECSLKSKSRRLAPGVVVSKWESCWVK